MSDHDFSDADEELDVDGFGSPAPSNGGGANADNPNNSDPKRHAKAQHNLLERRRRDNIKDMYTSLKEEIPNFNSDRASRAQILKKTIDLIQEQSADSNQLSEEVKQLEEKNAQLREKLQKRKEAKMEPCRLPPQHKDDQTHNPRVNDSTPICHFPHPHHQ